MVEGIHPGDIESLLEAMEAGLKRQLALVQAGKYEEVRVVSDAAMERVLSLLGESAAPAAADKRLWRIRSLQEKLALALTQQRDEAKQKLRQARRGKSSLDAYRQANG